MAVGLRQMQDQRSLTNILKQAFVPYRQFKEEEDNKKEKTKTKNNMNDHNNKKTSNNMFK